MEINENIVWCPKCKAEYYAWVKTCSDCLVDLVSEFPEEDVSLKDRLAPLELLVSVADKSAAEAITALLAVNSIRVIMEQNEDDGTIFAIDLYVSEPLMRKALTILHHQDSTEDKSFFENSVEDEATFEPEITHGKHSDYTGLQFFKECFADDEDTIYIAVASGRKFLKITGVLHITFSGLAIIGALISPDLSLSFILIFLSYVYHLFVGIMGVKYCNSVNKADLLCVLAIVSLLMGIFFLIRFVVLLEQIHLAILIFVFIGYVFDFALKSLYLVGAQKNRLAKRNEIGR